LLSWQTLYASKSISGDNALKGNETNFDNKFLFQKYF